MKNIKYIIVLIVSILCGAPTKTAALTHRHQDNAKNQSTLEEWIEYITHTKAKAITTATGYNTRLIEESAITETLAQTIKTYQTALTRPNSWLNEETYKSALKEITAAQDHITGFNQPCYVQKKVIENGIVTTFGDVHGDIYSLCQILQNLQETEFITDEQGGWKLKENHYLIFVGDYVDKGYFGIEVIFTLCKLKNANPDQVLFVLGNHEDPCMYTVKDNHHHHEKAFLREITAKYPLQAKELYQQCTNLLSHLPLALFIGNKNSYTLCCHAGIEHGYEEKALIESDKTYECISQLDRTNKSAYLTQLAKDNSEINKYHLNSCINVQEKIIGSHSFWGYKQLLWLWANYLTNQEQGIRFFDGEYSIMLDKTFAEEYFTKHPYIKSIIRGHQHPISSTLDISTIDQLIAWQGCYPQWSTHTPPSKTFALNMHKIYTLSLLPHSKSGKEWQKTYPKFNFAAYAQLAIRGAYDAWTMSIHTLPAKTSDTDQRQERTVIDESTTDKPEMIKAISAITALLAIAKLSLENDHDNQDDMLLRSKL